MKWKPSPVKFNFCNEVKQAISKLMACICPWLITSSTNIAMAQNPAEEEQLIKAAFIYNFAKFTRWPDNTWEKQDAPLNLCITGDDKLANELKHLQDRTIQGHSLSIQSLHHTVSVKSCHLLYIATSENKHYRKTLKTLHKKPILTVSELPHFARSGGIIELIKENDRTRFIINMNAAHEANIELSSRLLKLAIVIDDQEGAP